MPKMRRKNKIERGDVFYADLSPVIGSEQGGIRPVVILQNNVGNHYSPTVVVAIITSQTKKLLPTHVYIGSECGLVKDSIVLLEQIRTIDKKRLENFVTTLNEGIMNEIDKALSISLDIGEKKIKRTGGAA